MLNLNSVFLFYHFVHGPRNLQKMSLSLKEFNHSSTTMIVFGSLQNFTSLLVQINATKKRNQDFTERYLNIKAGTYKPMRIRDILTKTVFFAGRQRFRI